MGDSSGHRGEGAAPPAWFGDALQVGEARADFEHRIGHAPQQAGSPVGHALTVHDEGGLVGAHARAGPAGEQQASDRITHGPILDDERWYGTR